MTECGGQHQTGLCWAAGQYNRPLQSQSNHRHNSHNWRVREITWGSSPPPSSSSSLPPSLPLCLLSTQLPQFCAATSDILVHPAPRLGLQSLLITRQLHLLTSSLSLSPLSPLSPLTTVQICLSVLQRSPDLEIYAQSQ